MENNKSYNKVKEYDPNIGNGMMTKVWGPPGWLFLHCITFGYPHKIDKQNNNHFWLKLNY